MQFGTRSGSVDKARCQCIVVGVHEETRLSASAAQIDKASDGYLRRLLKRGDMKGKVGESLLLHDLPGINAARVLLVGVGKRNAVDAARFIQIAATTIAALKQTPAKNALCCLLEIDAGALDSYWKTRRLVEKFEDGIYRFSDMKGRPPEGGNGPESIDLQLPTRDDLDSVSAGIDDGNAVAAGINVHKNLSNTPGNICHPTYLAEAALKLAKDYDSITTTVLEEEDMRKLGMGAFLAVTEGSAQPAKLVIIQHQGGTPLDPPHVLVGKGITFDTGGISLKAGAAMHEMIWDMCGAASVLGTMTTVAIQQLPLNVIGVLAAAENMPSGTAARPGDIVRTMSGQTVEIINTDAEGRLVLCDALTFIEKYNPATVIDIATLTGAAVVALGAAATALFANDDQVAADLTKAAEECQDRVWRMPLWEDYQTQINSAFADMQNVGGREAGSITAACFLARFTKKYRWAHLDIAGTAYRTSGANKGATGRPVGLLTQYLMDRADADT